MPGDGTKTATTNAKSARCLDLTRLMSRVGRGPDTGVDRVERAYLVRLLAGLEPVFGLVRTGLGYVLLDRDGMTEIAARLSGNVPWGRVDLIGLLSRKASPARRRAHADLRRLALARCRTGRLAGILAKHLPTGCAYLNVGHSNLRDEVFAAWRGVHNAKIAVLIHDTIPLDFPQYQRPGTPEKFETKLRRVAGNADLVIYNSEATRADAERWFQTLGRSPEGLVAHLGVSLPRPDLRQLPPDLDVSKPYFVTVGTIEPRKNHALLLDVWDQLATDLPENEMPHLIIAGARGWANEAVFQRLDSSPMMNKHIFERPGLSDAALAALLAEARGVLCPSFAEGFGLPPVEAAMLGVPVLCAKLPVYAEILGNIPVYLQPDDVYLWKQSITRLTSIKMAGRQREKQADPAPGFPTWDDHFNLVLKVT